MMKRLLWAIFSPGRNHNHGLALDKQKKGGYDKSFPGGHHHLGEIANQHLGTATAHCV